MKDSSAQLRLMTSQEVGDLFRVDPKSVARWSSQGLIRCIRTPGGGLRFPENDVLRLLDGLPSHVLHLTGDQISAAIASLRLVTDRTFHGPLSEAEAAPLHELLIALTGRAS